MISMLLRAPYTSCASASAGAGKPCWRPPVDAIDALVGKLGPYVVIGTVQAAVVIGLARVRSICRRRET